MKQVLHKEGTDFDLDIRLYEELLKGIVVFEFEKSDGTIRKAFGTLNADLIPKYPEKNVEKLFEEARDFHTGFGTDTLIQGDFEKLGKAIALFGPKEKKERKDNPATQTYYDLGSKGWRSFTKAKLVAYYE